MKIDLLPNQQQNMFTGIEHQINQKKKKTDDSFKYYLISSE